MTAIVASNAPSIPDSNSSGTSTTAARGGSAAVETAERHAIIRSPTRGHSMASSHSRSSGVANARLASSPRSITPPGATVGPNRSVTAASTSSEPYSSCTTRSVDSTAAPARSSASSAVDLPAPIPPVSPMNGIRFVGGA